MPKKEKFMKQTKTILEKIGISDSKVKKWKEKGLKISYPMKKRKVFFRSDDGEVFVESADKFTPPLTKSEIILYTKHPENFKKDFLKNVRFYFTFHTFLWKKSKEAKRLEKFEEKVIAILSLLYLFLSAMDHHYYHFDRYLAYQEYPKTPLGYWWTKLKKFYFKVFHESVSKKNPPAKFLKVLARNKDIFNEFKEKLSKKEFQELKKTLKMIKIFEESQQKEIEIISGFPSKEDLLLRTGFGLWNKLCDLLTKHPESIEKKYFFKMRKNIKGHPITATRRMLLPSSLKYFKEEIF